MIDGSYGGLLEAGGSMSTIIVAKFGRLVRTKRDGYRLLGLECAPQLCGKDNSGSTQLLKTPRYFMTHYSSRRMS